MDLIQAMKDRFGKNEYLLTPYVVEKKSKFALICPGGGYGMVCSVAEGKPYAKKLNELGYSAFVLRYRIRSKGRYPIPMEDVAVALDYILEHSDELNVETSGYSLWGSSAGGHLVASFGTQNMGYSKYNLPKPSAIVLTYPVITMGSLTHQGSLENLLGENATQEQIQETSVEKQITPDYPPTFLWCGKVDDVVDYQNSVMMEQQLEENQVPHKFMLFESVGHGVGLAKGTEAEQWFQEAVQFWESHM